MLLLYVGIANLLHLLISHQAHVEDNHFELVISKETPHCLLCDFRFHQFVAKPYLDTYRYVESFYAFIQQELYEKSVIVSVLYVYLRGPPDNTAYFFSVPTGVNIKTLAGNSTEHSKRK
jgi:hypothetical protein